MPCGTKKYKKIMARVRRTYPNYSLKRRKRITYAVISRQKK